MKYVEAKAQTLQLLDAGQPKDAFGVFRSVVGFPAVIEDKVWDEALTIFAKIAGAIAGPELEARLNAATGDAPPEAYYDAAHALYEEGLFDVAATLLGRTNRITPGQEGIVTELSASLEAMMLYGAAAAMLQASGLVGNSPWCTYLFAYNSVMAGALDEGRKALDALPATSDENLQGACANLQGMLSRADALKGHSTLDHEDLDGWHMVLNGGILLHQSIEGFTEAMRGRYAYMADSYELLRAGLESVAAIAEAEALDFPRVMAGPDRSSQILASAAAKRLGVECVPLSEAQDKPGLVVVYDLDAVGEVEALEALRQHHRGQVLWAHASSWTQPFPFTPDITTYLYQVSASPWGGEGLQIDPETKEAVPRQADESPIPELAQRILEAEPAPSYADFGDLLALVHASRNTADAAVPGLFRSSGQRVRQQAGSPVPSNRFR